jgi:hypothetical protein
MTVRPVLPTYSKVTEACSEILDCRDGFCADSRFDRAGIVSWNWVLFPPQQVTILFLIVDVMRDGAVTKEPFRDRPCRMEAGRGNKRILTQIINSPPTAQRLGNRRHVDSGSISCSEEPRARPIDGQTSNSHAYETD